MQIRLLNKGYLLLEVTTPNIILIRKDKDNGEIEFGPYITNVDTGVFFSKYDYGNIFKVKILGFGIDLWWFI